MNVLYYCCAKKMLWFVLVVQFYLLILRLEYGFEWGKKKTIKRMILDKVRFE